VRVAALVALPAVAFASAEDVVGYGARSPALAGAGAATTAGYDAVYLNPAGLVDADARSMTYGFVATHFVVAAPSGMDENGDPRGETRRIEPSRGALIGVTLRIPFAASWRDRVTLGMGFFVPSNVVVRGDILLPEEPQMLLLDSRLQTCAVQLALGVRLTDRLAVGVGFRALAELVGSIRVATDGAGRIYSRSDSELVASYAPTLGARFALDDRSNVALTVRGALEGYFDYDIYTQDLPLELPVMNVEGVAQYDPFEAVLEASRRFGRARVEGGLTYARWSDYPGPTVATTEAAPEPPAVDVSDVVVPRLAGEWELRAPGASLHLRAGLAYARSPLGPGRQKARYYDDDRAILGAGIGLVVHRGDWPPLRLDVYEQGQLLVPREHADGERTSGAIWSTGVALGVSF
jgi:long-chain fatty acid transport protein